MSFFHSALAILALGVALAGTNLPAHAGGPDVPMSVIDARITEVRVEIDRLTSRARSYSITASEQKNIKREIQDLELRLANLQAAKPFMVAVPPQQQAAYVVFEKEREPSPTKPKIKKNNGFGNGDQDAPGNSEFNNNAENAVGKK